MTATRTPLAPDKVTARHPSFRTGRPEVWATETLDGVWSIEREEDEGTNWYLHHKPSMADKSWTLPVLVCGTRRACRVMVGSGEADKELARLKAGESED